MSPRSAQLVKMYLEVAILLLSLVTLLTNKLREANWHLMVVTLRLAGWWTCMVARGFFLVVLLALKVELAALMVAIFLRLQAPRLVKAAPAALLRSLLARVLALATVVASWWPVALELLPRAVLCLCTVAAASLPPAVRCRCRPPTAAQRARAALFRSALGRQALARAGAWLSPVGCLRWVRAARCALALALVALAAGCRCLQAACLRARAALSRLRVAVLLLLQAVRWRSPAALLPLVWAALCSCWAARAS